MSRKEPEARKEVYLTIDKNLQENTYKLLEEKVAGIVLAKLQNVLTYDPSNVSDSKNLIIPVGDAYYNLIGNSIIDTGHFVKDDAKISRKGGLQYISAETGRSGRSDHSPDAEQRCSGIQRSG